jgi:predicted transcriptional regulator
VGRKKFQSCAALINSYTFGMKIAISIPNEIFAEAEALARQRHKSRSELYRDALKEYIDRHDSSAVTEAMNRVCASLDTRPELVMSAVANRILEQNEW